jgi:hypothetical protein
MNNTKRQMLEDMKTIKAILEDFVSKYGIHATVELTARIAEHYLKRGLKAKGAKSDE